MPKYNDFDLDLKVETLRSYKPEGRETAVTVCSEAPERSRRNCETAITVCSLEPERTASCGKCWH